MGNTTTIHTPPVSLPGMGSAASGLPMLQLLAALSGGLPAAQAAVETLPGGAVANGGCRPQCAPVQCAPGMPGTVSQLLCSPNSRVLVEQLNRLLRPEVPAYPDCATFDPYSAAPSVLGQALAEIRAAAVAAKRYYDVQAPPEAAAATTDEQLAAITASLNALTTAVAAVQTSVTAIETDVDAVQTSVAAVQTSVTAIEADVDQMQLDIGDIQGRVTILEAA